MKANQIKTWKNKTIYSKTFHTPNNTFTLWTLKLKATEYRIWRTFWNHATRNAFVAVNQISLINILLFSPSFSQHSSFPSSVFFYVLFYFILIFNFHSQIKKKYSNKNGDTSHKTNGATCRAFSFELFLVTINSQFSNRKKRKNRKTERKKEKKSQARHEIKKIVLAVVKVQLWQRFASLSSVLEYKSQHEIFRRVTSAIYW